MRTRPRHVVVIGYGMAAARLIEKIRRADPDGRCVALTVVGEENVYAYNRILLASVLTARMKPDAIQLHDKAWAASRNINVFLGVAVAAVDRRARMVSLTSGERIRYDRLVFATGSSPWIPPTDGLLTGDGELADGVVAFRTLAECELLKEHVRPGTAAVVLGGGVLGLELARALLERTRHVTVVHPMAWIMERQLDQGAGRILATSLERMGIRLRIGRYAVQYRPGTGLRLDDASVVHANLVVVSAGARPETAVAAKAGLAVKQGIVVDDCLRTSDPQIFAIGDCAQHGGTISGFVEPAWEQAAVLGDLLTDERSASRYHGSKVVTSLKVPGVELMTLGDPHVDLYSADHEVLCLADPVGGRYARLVLRGDVVEGAIMLGLPDAAAATAHHYANSSPVPIDRLSLLVGRGFRAENDVFDDATSSRQRIVCLCNSVTRESLIGAWRAGARSTNELVNVTRATTGCGACGAAVRAMADQLARSERANQP
jgi:assimilatory nitrate reductase electron transfer subunit